MCIPIAYIPTSPVYTIDSSIPRWNVHSRVQIHANYFTVIYMGGVVRKYAAPSLRWSGHARAALGSGPSPRQYIGLLCFPPSWAAHNCDDGPIQGYVYRRFAGQFSVTVYSLPRSSINSFVVFMSPCSVKAEDSRRGPLIQVQQSKSHDGTARTSCMLDYIKTRLEWLLPW